MFDRKATHTVARVRVPAGVPTDAVESLSDSTTQYAQPICLFLDARESAGKVGLAHIANDLAIDVLNAQRDHPLARMDPEFRQFAKQVSPLGSTGRMREAKMPPALGGSRRS